MKITKEIIERLSSDTISKKEYDRIISGISKRVDHIWRLLCKISKRKLNWWAFRNDVELGNGNGSTGGNFDPQEDSEWIEIIGENSKVKNDTYEYNDGFPTNFLWMNDDVWTKIVIDNFKQSQKKVLQDQKDRNKTKQEPYYDNVLVGKTQIKDKTCVWNSCEYLAICFREPDDFSHSQVFIFRYCVPGRNDVYRFQYIFKRHALECLGFSSEMNLSLSQAVKLLKQDLKQPNVVEMITKACSKPQNRLYARYLLENILKLIDPKLPICKIVADVMQKNS